MPGKVQGLTPEAAVDRLEDIYAASCGALTQALDRYLITGEPPSAAWVVPAISTRGAVPHYPCWPAHGGP